MFIAPHTLSLITTHQCTAACDNCCFSCSPTVTDAIPIDRLRGLIDEAATLPSMRVVVFTGGECFLLGRELDALVAQATHHGFITRCITNGYWATTRHAAERRVAGLRAAGLKEINFSTGTFHGQHVPIERVIYGAVACADAGMVVLINVETCNEEDETFRALSGHELLRDLLATRRILLQRSVWIENVQKDGCIAPSHEAKYSRFQVDNMTGCETALNVIAVTPSQSAVACCGLHLEAIPELHLGSVADTSLGDIIVRAPDDFLKIWIHVEGPERVLSFVKEHVKEFELPVGSVHPCTTCHRVYTDPVVAEVDRAHYREIEDSVVAQYMTQVAMQSLDRAARSTYLPALAPNAAEVTTETISNKRRLPVVA